MSPSPKKKQTRQQTKRVCTCSARASQLRLAAGLCTGRAGRSWLEAAAHLPSLAETPRSGPRPWVCRTPQGLGARLPGWGGEPCACTCSQRLGTGNAYQRASDERPVRQTAGGPRAKAALEKLLTFPRGLQISQDVLGTCCGPRAYVPAGDHRDSPERTSQTGAQHPLPAEGRVGSVGGFEDSRPPGPPLGAAVGGRQRSPQAFGADLAAGNPRGAADTCGHCVCQAALPAETRGWPGLYMPEPPIHTCRTVTDTSRLPSIHTRSGQARTALLRRPGERRAFRNPGSADQSRWASRRTRLEND